jgi:hypothetical protein
VCADVCMMQLLNGCMLLSQENQSHFIRNRHSLRFLRSSADLDLAIRRELLVKNHSVSPQTYS